jgi:MFS family permease
MIGSFLPMLYIARGATYAASSYALSAALLAGMVGLFFGGHFSDRYGRKLTIMLTQFAAVPMLYGFLHTRGPVSLVLLLTGMLILSSTIPVNIILAQQAAPRLRGMASAIVMGLSFFAGAVIAPPFGALADNVGISGAMDVLFITPILGGTAAMLLRKE